MADIRAEAQRLQSDVAAHKSRIEFNRQRKDELGDLIERQATMSQDPDGRKKLLQDIQRYFIDQPGILMLTGQYLDWMAQPYVTDLYLSSYPRPEQWDTVWFNK